MAKLLGCLGIIFVSFLIWCITALILNFIIGFVFDIHLGFWKMFFIVWGLAIIGNLLFKKNGGRK